MPAHRVAEAPFSSSAVTGKAFPNQPVQGFGGVQFASSDRHWFLSGNGFGAENNSADFLRQFYQLERKFCTSR